jgi:RNA polymerase sigma-70 factor, ECF subfamily
MLANACTDRERRRKPDIALDELPVEPVSSTGDAFDRLQATYQRVWVERLLDRFPSAQAEVIRLRIYGELPFEEVAEAAGCSLAAAKARFRYGIVRLRKEIEDGEIA